MGSQKRLDLAILAIFAVVTSVHGLKAPFQASPEGMDSVLDCREIHAAEDQCEFFKKYCTAEDDGFISYLGLYYCRLAHVKPVAVIICIVWLAELFTTLGTVASSFFSVNMATLARALNTPDTLAGVTFLALGNGAPDIFSTIAAMQSDSPGMAIGELLGAAAFITTVVAGSMPFVESFSVFPTSLLRDAFCLAVTIAFLAFVMSIGKLLLWHCIVMVCFYVFYVFFVVIWHWYLSRKALTSKTPHEQDILEGGDLQPPAAHEGTPLLDENREAEIPSQSPTQSDPENGSRVNDYMAAIAGLFSNLRFQDKQHSQKRAELLQRPSPSHSSAEAERNSASGIVTSPDVLQAHSQARRSYREVLRQNTLHVLKVLFPSLINFKENNILHKIIRIFLVPSNLVLNLTVPVVVSDVEDPSTSAQKEPEREEDRWIRWLLILQLFCGPQFLLVLIANHLDRLSPDQYLVPAISCLGASIVLTLVVILTSSSQEKPSWYKLLVIPGFIWSVAWIAIVADETVAVFTALGVVGNVSEAILGLTLFAVGNSLDDLAANVSMAQHRHPVMALAACFGGPLLNILIGISVSGLILYCKGDSVIDLDATDTLFGEIYMVLATLVTLPCMLLLTRWRMTKLVGYCLIAIWVIGTAINLGINLS